MPARLQGAPTAGQAVRNAKSKTSEGGFNESGAKCVAELHAGHGTEAIE